MGARTIERVLCFGFCFLAILVFGGQSFSAETIVSIIPEQKNPFGKRGVVSHGWDTGFFDISEPANDSETTPDLTSSQDKVPLRLYLMFHDKDGNYIEETTDYVEASLHHSVDYGFEDAMNGERFIAVLTPMGKYYSFIPVTYLNLFNNYYIMEGIVGASFKVERSLHDDYHHFLEGSLLGLPLGVYTFYAGVDAKRNDQVDYDSLVYTAATLRLINPISVSLTASPLSGKAPLEVTFQVVVDDPKNTAKTCTLVYADEGKAGCATYNTHTFNSAGNYQVWADVEDKYGRYVSSKPVMIAVESASANRPPTVSNLSVTPNEVYSSEESFTIHYDYDDPDGKDDVVTHVIGIGTWSTTYTAGGSGQFQRSYNFGEGTTVGDHYIDAYVIDSAGNHSNTLSSSIYFGGGTKECGTFTEAGSDAAETHYVEMGQASGYFWFEYETFNQEDLITIYYENDPVPIFDSGCIGTNGTRSAHLHFGGGNSTQIMVHVEPNCAGGTGTRWNFTVRCPTSGPY